MARSARPIPTRTGTACPGEEPEIDGCNAPTRPVIVCNPLTRRTMPDTLPTARLILILVAASYPVAAGMLWWAKSRGDDVPWYWPTGWLVTGVLGLAFAAMLAQGRPWAWWGVSLALGPWMAVSLVVDVRHGYFWIAALDVAGLGAIAYALWLGRGAVGLV